MYCPIEKIVLDSSSKSEVLPTETPYFHSTQEEPL